MGSSQCWFSGMPGGPGLYFMTPSDRQDVSLLVQLVRHADGGLAVFGLSYKGSSCFGRITCDDDCGDAMWCGPIEPPTVPDDLKCPRSNKACRACGHGRSDHVSDANCVVSYCDCQVFIEYELLVELPLQRIVN